MKSPRIWLVATLLFGAGLPAAWAAGMSCPDLSGAVQVGACPSEEELRYTFTGYCSDDGKAYRGETDPCTDFRRYRQLKNVALWESADGAFDAYVSCDLPKGSLQQVRVGSIRVAKVGKITQLQCGYSNGITFIHRTRAQCVVETEGADCAANPAACKARCD